MLVFTENESLFLDEFALGSLALLIDFKWVFFSGVLSLLFTINLFMFKDWLFPLFIIWILFEFRQLISKGLLILFVQECFLA